MAKQTKQDIVYQYLYDKIYSGEYKPGSQLTEEGICAELNVSRTPVREAIRRLMAEELLEITPGYGLSVAQLRLDDFLEIYEIRPSLEQLAVRLFIERRNASAIQQLAECVSQQQQAIDTGDVELFMENDLRFHEILNGGSHNRRLINLLDSYYKYVRRMSNYIRDDSSLREDAVVEHKKILDAILEQDITAAQQAALEHSQSGKSYFLKRLYNL